MTRTFIFGCYKSSLISQVHFHLPECPREYQIISTVLPRMRPADKFFIQELRSEKCGQRFSSERPFFKSRNLRISIFFDATMYDGRSNNVAKSQLRHKQRVKSRLLFYTFSGLIISGHHLGRSWQDKTTKLQQVTYMCDANLCLFQL